MTQTTPSPIREMLRNYVAINQIKQGDLAKEIGIAPSTLCRFVASGRDLNQSGMLKLINWMFSHDGI